MTEHDTDSARRRDRTRAPEILTRRNAAEYLGVSVRTFDRMQQDAVIPYVTVGRRKKYLLRDLETFLQSQRSV